MAAQKNTLSKAVCFSMFTKGTDDGCVFQLELMNSTKKHQWTEQ